MTRRSIALAGALMIVALLAPTAQAGPAEDYTGIKRDWAANGADAGPGITACRFRQEQIVSAFQQSFGIADDNYTGFRDALVREYNRQKAGGCVSVGSMRVLAGSQLVLKASPTKARASRRTRFLFTVTVVTGTTRRAVSGARVSFAGSRMTTDAGGRAKATKTFRKSKGRKRAKATFAGLRSGNASVTVTRTKKKRR